MAIGNPFGIGQAVTLGIISATDRSQTFATTSTRLIQTDAAINSGNSGGALVNAQGQLIGINTSQLIASENVHGIGFAIPIEEVMKVYQDIILYGTVQRGWIGLGTTEFVTSKRIRAHGSRILSLNPDSPASEAGIEVGDIIISINDISVEYPNAINDMVSQQEIGTTVTLSVIRQNQELTFDVETELSPNL